AGPLGFTCTGLGGPAPPSCADSAPAEPKASAIAASAAAATRARTALIGRRLNGSPRAASRDFGAGLARGLGRARRDRGRTVGRGRLARRRLLGLHRGQLLDERVHDLALLHLAHDLALAEEQALARAAGDADVGLARLAGPVHRAAQHGDLHGQRALAEALLDLGHDLLEVDVDAAARGARDDLGRDHAHAGALEDVVRDRDLEHRVRRERDADRVADAAQQQRADAGGRLDAAVLHVAGLGDAHVQRHVALRAEDGVGLDGALHVGGLDRDDDLLDAVLARERDVA